MQVLKTSIVTLIESATLSDGYCGTNINVRSIVHIHNIFYFIILFACIFSFNIGVASATLPGASGRIVFGSNSSGGWNLYSMNSDGSDITIITTNVGSEPHPWPSPDGSQIVYNRNGEIYKINIDGTNDTRLTVNASYETRPTWSPDGQKISFQTNRDGNYEIYTMDTDGSNQVNITNNASYELTPNWSRDSTSIVFGSNRDGDFELYRVNANGSNIEQLTNNTGDDYNPDYSPDGTRIVYESTVAGNDEIFMMDIDGSNNTNVSNNPAGDYVPRWSPDGTKIIFFSNGDGDYEVLTMNVDGTNRAQLTFNGSLDWQPVWLGVNRAPILNDISMSVNSGSSIAIDLLTLTSDPDLVSYYGTLDPGSATITQAPSNGQLIVSGNPAEFTYTPNVGFIGQDSFTLQICDSANIPLCDSGTVTVTSLKTINLSGPFVVAIRGPDSYDKLLINGTISLNEMPLQLQITQPESIRVGDKFTIIDNQGVGSVNGIFSGLKEGESFTEGNITFVISYIGGDGNDIVLSATTVGIGVGVPNTGYSITTASLFNVFLGTFLVTSSFIVATIFLRRHRAK